MGARGDGVFHFLMNDYGMTSNATAAWLPVLSSTRLAAADFNGATWYFEIVASNQNAATPYNVLLIDGAGTTKASITVPANATARTRYRSAAFTLTAGESTYGVRMPQTAALDQIYVPAASLVLRCDDASKLVSEFPLSLQDRLSQINGAEGSIAGNGAVTRWDNPNFDGYPADRKYFPIFLWTAGDWSTVASLQWELIYQINAGGGTITFSLWDLTAGAAVASQAFSGSTANAPVLWTGDLSPSILTSGHEYELRGQYAGSDIAFLYKSRLRIRLNGFKRAQAWLVASKPTATNTATTDHARPLLETSGYPVGTQFYFETTAAISAPNPQHTSELFDAGAATSGTAGATVASTYLVPIATRARYRSTALPLTERHYVLRHQRASGSTILQTTLAAILAKIGA